MSDWTVIRRALTVMNVSALTIAVTVAAARSDAMAEAIVIVAGIAAVISLLVLGVFVFDRNVGSDQ